MSFLDLPRTRRSLLSEAARTSARLGVASSIFGLRGETHALASRLTRRLLGFDDAPQGHTLDPATVRALAERAIDAARAAGATYADVRLTRTVSERFLFGGQAFGGQYGDGPIGRLPSVRLSYGLSLGEHDSSPDPDTEVYGVGIRVLMRGGWGFAASPLWTMDEMSRLAAEAVRQAAENAKAAPDHVELTPTPVVTGTWVPPNVIDPFSIPPEEKAEHLRVLSDYVRRWQVPSLEPYREDAVGAAYDFNFLRQEWALATSEGTYCTQQFFRTNGTYHLIDRHEMNTPTRGVSGFQMWSVPVPGIVGQGWECYDMNTGWRRIEENLEAYFSAGKITYKRVDIGRYSVVCSGTVAATLIGQILGPATQLDRALGYEANAGGTSFLNDPLGMLGTFKVGTSALNVTGQRSAPGELATAQWDDEGVVPDEIPLVTDGVLTDFQTTRQNAEQLAPYYAKVHRPMRSHGNARATDALAVPLATAPNLVMHPGPDAISQEDMVKDVKKGLLFLDGTHDLDMQGANGMLQGTPVKSPLVREITNGKLGQAVLYAGMYFNSVQLLNSLVAIGGPATSTSVGVELAKGQPRQSAYTTVTAVPFLVHDVAIGDWGRR